MNMIPTQSNSDKSAITENLVPEQKKTISSREKKLLANLLIAVGVVIIIALTGFIFFSPHEEEISGQAEVEEIRISGKVPGRIAEYLVEEGQIVHKGDTLVRIYSPEVLAKLEQAEAIKSAAEALNREAGSEANHDIVNSSFQLWQSAKVGLEVAQKSFHRVERLYQEGVVPAQKYDEVKAKLSSMEAAEKAAKSQYDLAQKGLLSRGQSTTINLVNKAKGVLSEVDAYMTEGALVSPIDGVVSEIIPHEGELVGSGAPIMNIEDRSTFHVQFSVREDKLSQLTKGTQLRAYIPALENKKIYLVVTKIKDLGAYAVWKSTKPSGQIDLRSFQITAKPMVDVPELIPGMTVVIEKGQIK